MKKLIAVFLILSLVLVGCTAPDSDPSAPSSPDLQQGAPTEGTSSQTDPTDVQEGTRPGPETSDPTSTSPSVPDSTENGTEGTTPAGPTEGTTPTEPKPTSPQATEKPTTPTTPPEETKPTTPPVTTPTNPPETTPTQPPETRPEETEPPTTTPPTEPAGCNHEWKCIHHPEEGHWRAGIICDCGWTVYGDPSELTALWNAHSASYPPAESLFDHGGFGSMDEWIVDKPAYDEWVCRHCGEPKP